MSRVLTGDVPAEGANRVADEVWPGHGLHAAFAEDAYAVECPTRQKGASDAREIRCRGEETGVAGDATKPKGARIVDDAVDQGRRAILGFFGGGDAL